MWEVDVSRVWVDAIQQLRRALVFCTLELGQSVEAAHALHTLEQLLTAVQHRRLRLRTLRRPVVTTAAVLVQQRGVAFHQIRAIQAMQEPAVDAEAFGPERLLQQ